MEITQLHLSAEAVEEIREQSYAGLMALPRRGAEIGGFLILPAGDLSRGEPASLQIVASEHRFGPSYSLSPGDLLIFESKVREIQEAGNSVVSYFRSCTGNSMEMTGEDLTTLKIVLPDVELMLMAKPAKTGRVTYSLFRRNADGLWSGPEEAEFAGTAQEAQAPTAPAIAEQYSPPVTALPVAAIPVEVKGRFGKRRIAVASGLVILSALTAGAGWQRYSQPPRKGVPPGLRVVREGGSMRVIWDRSMGLDRTSTAKLTIQDGESVREMPLNGAQVASGSVLYTPNSKDVLFRMEVQTDNLPVQSELLRVVSAREPETRAPFPTAKTGSRVSIHPLPAVPPHKAEKTAAVSSPMPSGKLPGLRQQFLPPENPLRGGPGKEEREPVELEVPPAGVAQHPLAPALPEPPQPIARHISQPPSVFKPPTPVRKVIPAADGLGWKVNYPVDVSIQVTVDASGRVVAARQAPNETPGAASLVSAGLRAAREWSFEPGTRDGKPISSEHIIVFHFRPH
ncbi:MAG: energy transducer TonB [Acidobacteriota bacterium]|nr:energy transducer TonB [Acidobacteriota bacterium]